MKTVSFAVALLALCTLVGCDHLRSRDAQAEQTAKKPETSTAPASTMPGSDRYGTTAEAKQ